MSDCRICSKPIRVMSQIGTGLCSENCRKVEEERGDPTLNRDIAARARRDIHPSPTPNRRPTTFKGN